MKLEDRDNGGKEIRELDILKVEIKKKVAFKIWHGAELGCVRAGR